MAASTAQSVATALINLSHDKQKPVSNLKLQKLLYYAQAWYLVFYKNPLFDEEIQAWVHGPVVPAVFRHYKDFKWSPIARQPLGDISAITIAHLEEVWRVYGNANAYELEKLTHSEDPWKNARAGLSADVSSYRVISKQSIRKFYLSRLHG